MTAVEATLRVGIKNEVIFSITATLLSIFRKPCVAYGKSVIHFLEKERQIKKKLLKH